MRDYWSKNGVSSLESFNLMISVRSKTFKNGEFFFLVIVLRDWDSTVEYNYF